MTNFLDARCPQCGGTDQIDVAATLWVRLTPDGTDADASHDGSHDYGYGSPCICRGCGHPGTLDDFAPDPSTVHTASNTRNQG